MTMKQFLFTIGLLASLSVNGQSVWRNASLANMKGASVPESPAWSPSNETSVVMWLDPTTLSLEDGATVESWGDSSASGTNDVSPVGQSPYYYSSVKNGKPCVSWTNRWALLVNSLASDIKPLTVAFVAQSQASDYGVLWGGNSGSGSVLVGIGNGTLNLMKAAQVDMASLSGIATDTWYVGVITYDSSGNYVMYTNGIAGKTGQNDQTFTGGNGGRSGSDATGGSQFRGMMGDFIIANTNWSGATVTNFMNWANTKYAVY